MSQLNWKLMVEKGIAGDHTVTCFVAALDCLSDDRDIPYRIYAEYTKAFWHQYYFGVNRRTSREVYQEVLKAATGSICLRNITSRRVTDPKDLATTLQNANQGGKKVIIRTDFTHNVGLKHIGSGVWIMVGNSLPCHEAHTPKEIFPFLYIPSSSEQRGNRENVYLIN